MLAGAAAFFHPGSRYAHLKHSVWIWIGADGLLSLVCLLLSVGVSSRGWWRQFAGLLDFPAPFFRKAGRHLPWLAGFSAILGGIALRFDTVGMVVIVLFMGTETWRWMMKRKKVYVRCDTRFERGE